MKFKIGQRVLIKKVKFGTSYGGKIGTIANVLYDSDGFPWADVKISNLKIRIPFKWLSLD